MNELDLTSSAVDWAIDFPPAVPLFDELGIDYHCGGKSLKYLCRRRGLDPHEVLARLKHLAKSTSKEPPRSDANDRATG